MNLVSPSVGGLLSRGAVVAQGVGLDHEAEAGPEEIDVEAVDLLLGERRRKARLSNEWQEGVLEL